MKVCPKKGRGQGQAGPQHRDREQEADGGRGRNAGWIGRACGRVHPHLYHQPDGGWEWGEGEEGPPDPGQYFHGVPAPTTDHGPKTGQSVRPGWPGASHSGRRGQRERDLKAQWLSFEFGGLIFNGRVWSLVVYSTLLCLMRVTFRL